MAVKTPKTSSASNQDRPPEMADVSPPYRGNDYRFEYQALFDIQKSIGELKASVDALKSSTDSTKAKVEDLIGWKNKILGGVFVLGAIFSLIGFVVAKASDYVTIKPVSIQSSPTQLPALPQPQTLPKQ